MKELHAEFGWKSRVFSAIGGRWVLRQIRKEEKRLAAGFSYEPATFYERNAAVADRPEVPLCRSAVPLEVSVVRRARSCSRYACAGVRVGGGVRLTTVD